jgi:NuA3 HAT complex component NTO1
VFTNGLNELQTKLDQKFYTSVQAFSEDMSAVFSSKIEFAILTSVNDAEQQLSDVAHSSLTAEQKETKKLAKRIIKAIQPSFEDAMRNESDLAGKSYERELPDLETLLDQRLRRQETSQGGGIVRATTEINHPDEVDADGEPDDGQDAEGEIVEEDAKSNMPAQLAPTPEDNSPDHRLSLQDDAADEAAIAAQFGQDALHASTSGSHPDVMDVDQQEAQGQISGGGAAPLTPPRSEKDLLAPLAYGGTPWYMEPFDIEGTTIHEEKWTGRDILREMSEQLSEMEDDALDDLDPMDGSMVDAHISDTLPARKQKKRTTRYG